MRKKLQNILEKEMNNESANYIIKAPTGSGKTAYVFSKLLPRALKDKGKILYLVNRNAVARQVHKKCSEYAQKYSELAREIFDAIVIVTYQSLESYLLAHPTVSYNSCYHLSHYKFVILDEAHYFWHDSNFNPHTYLSYQYLTQPGSTKLFMSATLDDAMIQQLQKNLYNQNCASNVVSSSNHHFFEEKVCKSIILPDPDYSYLHIHAFDNLENIPQIVGQCKGKTLIFVSSITEGEKICHLLSQNNIEDVSFLNSSYRKDMEMAGTMQQIQQQEAFSSKILISTAVIDNGVNLCDSSIKNVFALIHNPSDLIQMIGRKRVNKGEHVELYLCKRNKKYFTDLLRGYNQTWQTYVELNRIGMSNVPMFYYQCDPSKREDIEKLGFFQQILHFPYQTLHYCLNPLSIQSVASNIQICNTIAERFDRETDSYTFIRQQIEWLGTNLSFDICSQADNLLELEALLFPYCNKELTTAEMTEIVKKEDVALLVRKLSSKKICDSTPVTKNMLKSVLNDLDTTLKLQKTSDSPVIYKIVKLS